MTIATICIRYCSIATTTIGAAITLTLFTSPPNSHLLISLQLDSISVSLSLSTYIYVCEGCCSRSAQIGGLSKCRYGRPVRRPAIFVNRSGAPAISGKAPMGCTATGSGCLRRVTRRSSVRLNLVVDANVFRYRPTCGSLTRTARVPYLE